MKKIFITLGVLGIIIVVLVGVYITIENTAIHIVDQHLQELSETKKEEQYSSLDSNEDKNELSQDSSKDEDDFFGNLNKKENKAEIIQQMIDEVGWEVQYKGSMTIVDGYFTNTQDFTIDHLSLGVHLIDSNGDRINLFPTISSLNIEPNDTILLQFKAGAYVNFAECDFKPKVINAMVDNEVYFPQESYFPQD